MKKVVLLMATGTAVFLLNFGDDPQHTEFGFGLQLIPEAHAVFGVRRRSFRRGVIIGGSAAAGAAATSASATVQNVPTSAPPPAPTPAPPAANGEPLPLGTVVSSLPAGCTTKTVSGVAYYHCGGNYYRAVFQGNNLVYVTAKP